MWKKSIYVLSLVCVLTLMSTNTSLGFNAGRDPSLVGWWRLDEPSGTAATDSSGQGNDATLGGSASQIRRCPKVRFVTWPGIGNRLRR